MVTLPEMFCVLEKKMIYSKKYSPNAFTKKKCTLLLNPDVSDGSHTSNKEVARTAENDNAPFLSGKQNYFL